MKTIEEINQNIIELRRNGQSVKKISDSYHTFGDYIDMRNIYFIALCNAYPELSWKSKKHFDEENDPMFEGDFIAGIFTPDGPITQHLKLKFWDELSVQEIERAPQYDGYTEEDVKIRIKSLNGGNVHERRKKFPKKQYQLVDNNLVKTNSKNLYNKRKCKNWSCMFTLNEI